MEQLQNENLGNETTENEVEKTDQAEQPYKVFQTKSDFEEAIKKTLKNIYKQKDEVEIQKNETEKRLTLLEQKLENETKIKKLSDFDPETHDYLWSLIDKEKDIDEQINVLKETKKKFLKQKSYEVEKPEKDKKEIKKERRSGNVFF